jgi:outer membrane lipoprotein carrier protein
VNFLNKKKACIGFLLWSVATLASAVSANEVLWRKLSEIKSMKSGFTQVVYANQRELSKSTGTMALERPEHFRWHTALPMEQLLIADGKKFWLYDVDLEQVTVRPQSKLSGAVAGLFLGEDKAQFLKAFEVTEDKKNVFKLKATEKQANIQQMQLQFAGAVLDSMILYDQLGQRTVMRFQQVKNNTALPARLFRFSPPVGVDVVQQ